jgi:hypothetical protein
MVPVLSKPAPQFAAALVFLLTALVATHLVVLRRSGDALNLLSLAAAFYLVAFFAGGIYAWFALRHGPEGVPGTDITAAVAVTGVAWLCFAAGYLADSFRFVRRIVPPPACIAAAARTGPLLACLLGSGWAARLLLVSEGRYYHTKVNPVVQAGSSWYVYEASLLPLVALAVAGAGAFGLGGKRPRGRSWILFLVLLATELAWAVPSGSREEIVDVLVLVVVVRYYARRRLPSPRVVAAITLALVFVVFPLVGAYRSGDFRSSPTGALLTATTQVRDRSLNGTLKAGGDTLARFADVTSLARILEQGRDRMAFSTADTISYSLEGFVPRALFPQKPQPSAFGNEFGRAYGFLSPNDVSTAVAVTEPGELYLGGGWLALLLGMPLLGALLRTLDEYLRARRSDLGVLALYAVIAPSVVVGLETSIAVGFVGALKSAIFIGLVVAAFGWLRPHAPTQAAPRARHGEA